MSTLTPVGAFLRKTLTPAQKKAIKRILFRPFFRRAISDIALAQGSDLSTLAVLFGSDKAGSHHYAKHYEHHFGPLRQRTLNVLEIGIGGFEDSRLGGASLRMWKAFFPNSQIFGIDIVDKSYHDEHRIRTFKGSQVDEVFLRRVADQIGEIDIVIDDGSHLNAHVVATFKTLFPLLAPNGIYAIEDLQTSYWEAVGDESWDGSSNLAAPHTSMNFLKSLVDGLNHAEFMIPGYTSSYFDKHIVAIHFYHNLAFVYKGENNEASNRCERRSAL